jgi:hypothetical protein
MNLRFRLVFSTETCHRFPVPDRDCQCQRRIKCPVKHETSCFPLQVHPEANWQFTMKVRHRPRARIEFLLERLTRHGHTVSIHLRNVYNEAEYSDVTVF